MDVRIRPATMADYDALCALFEEVDAPHREALPHIFRAPDGPARARDYIAGIVSDENRALLVAESGGAIIGFVHVDAISARDIPILVPRRYAMIDSVVVTAAARRRGVGRRLMAAAEQWALGIGATQVELSVWEINAGARAFYESLGYATMTRRMARPLE